MISLVICYLILATSLPAFIYVKMAPYLVPWTCQTYFHLSALELADTSACIFFIPETYLNPSLLSIKCHLHKKKLLLTTLYESCPYLSAHISYPPILFFLCTKTNYILIYLSIVHLPSLEDKLHEDRKYILFTAICQHSEQCLKLYIHAIIICWIDECILVA